MLKIIKLSERVGEDTSALGLPPETDNSRDIGGATIGERTRSAAPPTEALQHVGSHFLVMEHITRRV